VACRRVGRGRPNKRLKLATVIALREAECCAPNGHGLTFHSLELKHGPPELSQGSLAARLGAGAQRTGASSGDPQSITARRRAPGRCPAGSRRQLYRERDGRRDSSQLAGVARAAPQLPTEFWTRFEARLVHDTPELLDSIAVLYARSFSLEELKALAAFYSPPVGERLRDLQPSLVTQSSAIGQRWGSR